METFSNYPPRVSPAELQSLQEQAIDWSLSHGSVVRPPANIALPQNSSVIHAPMTLFPSPFPKKLFEDALLLQPIFNRLFHKLAQDHAFISKIMEEVAKVDDFVEKLYKIYSRVKTEGVAQPISLGLHRSDYLLHLPPGYPDPRLLQVEFNTISSSFSSLSGLVGEMHKYLLESTNYFDSSGIIKNGALPPNESLTSLAKGIAKAHVLYGSQSAVVAFIVQPGERNAFDQRWIEYNLLKNHKVYIIRKTLLDVFEQGSLDPETKALHINGKEISVCYFRAAYAPGDFPTQKEWDARLLIERSKSIKCPTVAYQLVGTKKVQQVLADKGVVERYVSNTSDVQKLRACFAGLYPLDSSPEGEAAVRTALQHPERYVMKPQREGGGNNIYAHDIPPKLTQLSRAERSSYILMDLIQPPPVRNFLLRQGELIEGEVVSELGIYGVFIGTVHNEVVDDDSDIILNETGGHLLRTKGRETNEGGVAAGFAVIDSPVLI